MKQRKRKSRKGEKHERPLSLYGLSLNQALDKILAAKPAPRKKK
jgi:hypothetical protein